MKISTIEGCAKLYNGVEMPYIGLGTYLTPEGSQVENSVLAAIECGYRHFDTAVLYGNESGIGNAINKSGISRDDLFITTKVWNSDQGFDSTLRSFDESLNRLQTDYVDLYLIHWPVKGKYKETWKALEELYHSGSVRAIGVSNFMIHHLDDLITDSEIIPMVNQVEFHPLLVQQPLLDYCVQNAIQFESWSPFMQGRLLTDSTINQLATKYGKTGAQIIVRWNLQKNVVVIPKSVNAERIKSNADVFDFELSDTDMNILDNMDKGKRIGADPDNFNF